MKNWKQCPMFIMVLLSAAVIAGIGMLGRDGTYQQYQINAHRYNPIAWVFLGMKDGVYPWHVTEDVLKAWSRQAPWSRQAQDAYAAGNGTDVMEEEDRTQDEAEQDGAAKEAGADSISANTAAEQEADSQEQEPVRYDFVTVDESYFDDALFIGDSRTVGLWEYAGMQERATFFCKTSLTIWNVLEKPIVKNEEGKNITVDEALQERTFGKIYLMLGINELGRGNTELFMEQYQSVVARIQKLQPDAIIFVEGIMRVSGQKNQEDPIFNNKNINERNERIAQLADGVNLFYIDVNEAVCDENGDLVADYTYDQIHLKAAYYDLWKQFLLEHGIVKQN